MSTTGYLDKLTIDQLRFCRDEADKRIKAAEAKPKKIVWVISNNCWNEKWFREEQYAEAFAFYLKHLEKAGTKDFERFIEERPGARYFELAVLRPQYENEVEYEEWFK